MKIPGLLIAALLLTACGNSGTPSTATKAEPKTYDVRGTMSLDASGNEVAADNGRVGAQCYGQNGWDDVQKGAQVVVRDDKGKTVGVGTLGIGAMTTRLYAVNATCVFDFVVPDVASTSDFLSVEVAHRGQVQFKRTDAGAVALTLSATG